jgi:hypothetical protein
LSERPPRLTLTLSPTALPAPLHGRASPPPRLSNSGSPTPPLPPPWPWWFQNHWMGRHLLALQVQEIPLGQGLPPSPQLKTGSDQPMTGTYSSTTGTYSPTIGTYSSASDKFTPSHGPSSSTDEYSGESTSTLYSTASGVADFALFFGIGRARVSAFAPFHAGGCVN